MDTENQELTESGINCRVGEWRQNWRPNRGRRKPISIERPKSTNLGLPISFPIWRVVGPRKE